MRATRALTRENAGGCPAGCGRARGSVRSSLSNGKVTSMSPAWTCTPRVLGSSLVSTGVQLLCHVLYTSCRLTPPGPSIDYSRRDCGSVWTQSKCVMRHASHRMMIIAGPVHARAMVWTVPARRANRRRRRPGSNLRTWRRTPRRGQAHVGDAPAARAHSSPAQLGVASPARSCLSTPECSAGLLRAG